MVEDPVVVQHRRGGATELTRAVDLRRVEFGVRHSGAPDDRLNELHPRVAELVAAVVGPSDVLALEPSEVVPEVAAVVVVDPVVQRPEREPVVVLVRAPVGVPERQQYRESCLVADELERLDRCRVDTAGGRLERRGVRVR